jgi:hypothetical protein
MKKGVWPEYSLAELPVTDLGHVMQEIKNWRMTLRLLQEYRRHKCLQQMKYKLKKKHEAVK